MATYSNLGITLITTGDESGTWGTTTNGNFDSILDEAIAGVVTYNISSDANFTLTVVDATSSDARHAVIKFTSTTLSATRTCTFAPNDLQKTWVVINATTGGQSLTFKQGSAGATVTVPNGESAIIYSDGGGASAGAITRVLDSFTNTKITTGTLNATTLDLTNLEVTNIKAKDGTAALTIADSTGKVTVSSEFAVDNLNLSGNAITSTDTNGNIDLTPNGTGEVNITKVDIDGGTIDNVTIGGGTAAAGTFTTLGATTGNITTVNATTVDTTNVEVTNIKAKDGTAAGSIADSTGVVTLASSVLTTTDINGGTIDGTTIGGSTAAAGTFTSLTNSGNLIFSSTAQRITGDFTNSTASSRLLFQSSTTNGLTAVGIIPNGTSTTAAFVVNNASDASNASFLQLLSLAAETRINSSYVGTGSYLPLTFYTGGSERMRLDTSGNLGIGTASPAVKLNVIGDVQFSRSATASDVAINFGSNSNNYIYGGNANNLMAFATNGSERMRIDSSGNVGIGTASPGTRLTVLSATNAGISVTDGTVTTIMYNSTGGVASIGTTSNHSVNLLTNNTTRVTFDNSGNVGIGGTADAFAKFKIAGTLPTSSTISVVNYNQATIPSGTTSTAYGYYSALNTQAASFTLGGLIHYYINPGTFGAGSAVSNQYGYYCDSTLTGATNNYGFFSNIASGTNRWNFYAAGTAANYFAGDVGIGRTPAASTRLTIKGQNNGSGNFSVYVENSTPTELFKIRDDGTFYTGLAGNSPYNLTTGSAANAFVDSDGILRRSTSSLRYKSDVADADHGLSDVLKLRSVTYRGKNDGDKTFGGLIAEEVHDAGLTEFVVYDKEGRPDALHYGNMVALLVKAVQELKAELEALKTA